MPFYLHVPLPGPVSYSKRLGGRKRGPSGSDPVAVLVTVALFVVGGMVYLVGWWTVPILAVLVGLPLWGRAIEKREKRKMQDGDGPPPCR